MASVIVGAPVRTASGASSSPVVAGSGPTLIFKLVATNADAVDRHIVLMDGSGTGGRESNWPAASFSLFVPAGAIVPFDFGVHGMLFQQSLVIGCAATPGGSIVTAPFQYTASVAGI